MKRILNLLLCAFVFCVLPASAQNSADPVRKSVTATLADASLFSTKPIKKANGAKWRLAYFRSGEYVNYPPSLKATIRGLEALGWLEIVADIPDKLTGRALWKFLAQNTRSAYIELVADAFWEPGDFDAAQRPVARAAIHERLTEKNDIDLIIAMGTWAGQDMVKLGVPVPAIVISASNPLKSGIIKSYRDSGYDNLNARVYPDHHRDQIRLFHDIIPFTRLGMVYEDTLEGRAYAGLDDVRELAKQWGFEVLTCEAPFAVIGEIEKKIMACYEKLAREADAIYVTEHRAEEEVIAKIAEILRRAKIPSFSMQGAEEVKAGILMSMAQADFSYIGMFHAETIARIFNGAKPRQLTQIWADPEKIVLNFKTTRIIGFNPPVDILLAADEVYETR
ncbi:hypothetical protein AGMMS50256_31930 [Betaproteobacteria bacterium]|nr:hypothetical protein AGMMS50256_31930 [Betaproteobacteria bacterium]